ncbi:VC0807 family protein [Paenibacillus sp. D51F]
MGRMVGSRVKVLHRIPAGAAATVLMNAVLPYVAYRILSEGMTGLQALLIATCLPLLEQLWHLARRRKPDAFGLLMAGLFVLGAGAALAGGGEQAVLLRESLVTGAAGAAFLLSLAGRRPLVYRLAARFVPAADAAAMEQRWELAEYRRASRVSTVFWGALLLGESMLRVGLVLVLSVETFLAVSGLLLYGTLGFGALWSMTYRRRTLSRINSATPDPKASEA